MDAITIADLKRATEAARETTLTVGAPGAGKTITLRVPTAHEVKLAGMRSGVAAKTDVAALSVLERTLLCGAIVAWVNLVQTDVLPGAPAEPLPCLPEACALLLDAQPEWEQALSNALFAALAARVSIKAAAEKNS